MKQSWITISPNTVSQPMLYGTLRVLFSVIHPEVAAVTCLW